MCNTLTLDITHIRFRLCVILPDPRSLPELQAVGRPGEQAESSRGVKRGSPEFTGLASPGLLASPLQLAKRHLPCTQLQGRVIGFLGIHTSPSLVMYSPVEIT